MLDGIRGLARPAPDQPYSEGEVIMAGAPQTREVRMVMGILALIALMFTVYTQSPILGILTGLLIGEALLWR